MNAFWNRHRAWIIDCAQGLGYAYLIILLVMYSGANSGGFRYFEL